jgi:aminoglycoside phosphotransferase (APT) family kinase protein
MILGEDTPKQIRAGEELDVAKLTAYLERQFGAGEVTVAQFPGGHSNLTYLVRHGERDYVLRRPPFGNKVKSAHDMGREFTVLTKLSGVYDCAPRPFAYEPTGDVLGAPFYLMERRRGVILRKDLPAELVNDHARVRRVCDHLVDALAGADALAVVTEWNEFREPDFERMRSLLKAPVIFDGRNIYSPEQMRALGFTYFSIGR